MGLYEGKDNSVAGASRRTVAKMASMLSNCSSDTRVLDLGSGYGGAARYLVREKGCYVDCLNLSRIQNERHRRMNREQRVDGLIQVVEGNFENIPFCRESYDVIWSEDAIVHCSNRHRVFEEVDRVLKRGGEFIFTDLLQSENCPEDVLEPILARIHLDSLGSFKFYRETAQSLGWEESEIIDLSSNLAVHYACVYRKLEQQYDELRHDCGQQYLDSMKVGLMHWVTAGEKGHLMWGILHFRKS